jgi:hypothetical protein
LVDISNQHRSSASPRPGQRQAKRDPIGVTSHES